MKVHITEKDVNPLRENFEGKLVVVKIDFFSEPFKEAKYQLVKAFGGFGCHKSSRGTCVMVQDVFPETDGGIKREKYRVERYNLLGEPTEACLQEYRELYGEIVL